MALTFGGATSDRVNLGTSFSIGSTAFTICAWVYVTTLTSNRAVWASRGVGGGGGGNALVAVLLNGTGGNFGLVIRSSAGANVRTYVANDTPLSSTSTWQFVAATYDSGLGTNMGSLYAGSLTAAPTLRTLGTNTESGTPGTESANSANWGNNNVAGTIASALQGRMAVGQLYNRALSLGELTNVWMSRGRLLSGCTNYIEFGFNGTGTQPDWSGNGISGTITGATLTPDHVPLGPPFGLFGGWPGAFTAATVTGSPWLYYAAQYGAA